jgi:hypothetical protein
MGWDEGLPDPQARPHAMGVWCFCATLLLGPSVLVWLVRLSALGMGCEPGPDLCRNIAVGGGLRDTLDLAWLIGSNSLISLGIAFAAAIVALRLRRPLLASLSLMILPLTALVLPTLAVYTALYSGCEANEAGVGDCVLWGARMGMSFHRAAMAPWIVYGVVPYSFTFALMIGAIGLLFFRQRTAMNGSPLARPSFNRAAKSFDDSRD